MTGTQWASGPSPCWPTSANFSYKADVTSVVTGNGSYKLAGFATGQSDGADPWTSGSAAPMDEGASLVVVYELSSMPQVTVQIAEGATETHSGNLAADLKTLKDKYPGVPILVMNYYNPFPPAPAAKQSACLFSDAATLFYEHAQEGWLGAVEIFILQHRKFTSDARMVQARLYKDAQTVLDQLNKAINTTSSGVATVVNTNDFAGHDICAHGSEWVFSPTFAIDMSLKIGPASNAAHLSVGGDAVCPDPVSPIDKNFKISEQFSVKFLHISGSLNISAGLNCLPHPTVEGQTAIADDFLNQGGWPDAAGDLGRSPAASDPLGSGTHPVRSG